MAKVTGIITCGRIERQKTRRPGIHSKCKTSRLKSSKNYKKVYKGQGR